MARTTDIAEVDLHDSQGLIQVVNPNVLYALWQRAGGKTGGGIGPRFVHLNNVMPRSQILLFSDTYDRLKKRIVPNIVQFWVNKLGWEEGVDFVKYKRPPEHFEKPLIPLDDFEHVISTASGTALCLVSLHVKGSANAYNAQAAIGDEVKYCDEQQINTEVIPALRGEHERWGYLPEYLSVWMFTDKFGPKTKWLLGKRKKVNQPAVNTVIKLQEQILKWEAEMQSFSSLATINEYKKKIQAYSDKANEIRKYLMYVSEMKPYENMRAVGERFYRMQKIICTVYEYEVAILNKDPDKVEQSYYPMFSSLHKHAIDNDYNPNLPFIIASDYNFRISPIPVVQVDTLPGSEYKTVNFIDCIYELYPMGQEDAVRSFSEKYKDKPNRIIHYIFDHTAIGRNTLKTTFKDEMMSALTNNGWIVIEHYIGDAPDHDIKYKALINYFVNQGEFAIRVHMLRCEQMIKSIEQSPAIIVNGQTKKDKRTEKDKNFPADDSTHISDAVDQILWGLFEWDIKSALEEGDAIPMIIG
jgi:hypothetical protein